VRGPRVPPRKSSSGSPEPPLQQLLHPLSDLTSLPEYSAAGLTEWHATEYFPGLAVTTAEDFLGLIRGVPRILAEEIGTSYERLSDLYNAAVVDVFPSMASSTIETVMQDTYGFGAELSAPPQSEEAEPLDYDVIGTPPAQASSADTAGPAPGDPALAPGAIQVRPTADVSLIDAFMPPIIGQGDRGTCVAFATIAVLEYLWHRVRGEQVNLAEQFLYWQIKRKDSFAGEGSWLQFGFSAARKPGICRMELWPYAFDLRPNDLTHGDPPHPQACERDARKYTFTRIVRLVGHQDPAALQSEISEGRPVAVVIPVYGTWSDNLGTRISGKILLPLGRDAFTVGGHAITLVGFKHDASFPGGGYFIVRNSWGTNWARHSPYGPGYGMLPFRYIEKYGRDAWTGHVD
jgi:hypothetical protein